MGGGRGAVTLSAKFCTPKHWGWQHPALVENTGSLPGGRVLLASACLPLLQLKPGRDALKPHLWRALAGVHTSASQARKWGGACRVWCTHLLQPRGNCPSHGSKPWHPCLLLCFGSRQECLVSMLPWPRWFHPSCISEPRHLRPLPN